MIGMENAVLGLERHMGRRPPDAQDYRIFTLEGECRASFLVMPGFETRRASPEMADQLWPLERAYQIEEVLRPGHNMNERLTRKHFTETLKRQLIYCGYLHGRPIAKAGTNARGFNYDQIGGVYVEPELRNLGVGRTVLRGLITRIAEEGRYSCLFVKSTNAAAIRLYRALGFTDRGTFRISYWIG
jgi:predicted GNAT family acetyltransferase